MPNDGLHPHELIEELFKLKELQNKVRNQAVFGGMLPAEAKEYDDRQQRIMKIVASLEGESGKS
jgi:hypothetical protein